MADAAGDPVSGAAPGDLVETFRAATARLAAGVCVVSAARRRGGSTADHAMTVTSFVPVSLYPPMALFCVHAEARMREVLDDVDTWAVSVLDARAGHAAEWLATPGRPTIGQLGPVAHHRGVASGAALLDGAQAWVECRTAWIRPAGDHDVVVGEVVSAQVAPGARGALVHRLGRLAPLPD